jgi:hypothetical protein
MIVRKFCDDCFLLSPQSLDTPDFSSDSPGFPIFSEADPDTPGSDTSAPFSLH